MMHDFAPFLDGTGQTAPEAARSEPAPASRHFPVLFLSDMHLGSPACREADLLGFLTAHTADTIYLVGDIIDTWVATSAPWSVKQHQILRLLLDRAATGTRLVYTPGNHDGFFRQYCGQTIASIEVVNHILHESGDGTRYLVIHGDCCDVFEQRYPRLAKTGARLDCLMRRTISKVNQWRRKRGRPDWTLAERVVKRVNDVIRNLDNFDARLSELAKFHGADGIICGHFHKPDLHANHGVAYANCGDWVENSTALAETSSGRLLLLDWATRGQSVDLVGTRSGLGETVKGI
ncbi:MAG: UDP-2,3-diacylglucosamine diphosphatase [Candidatus Saccharibacteria bacterium]|nr:UDP-2,3-diacylglucosamine diphosphatase [Pseudorhodobacter sp.]